MSADSTTGTTNTGSSSGAFSGLGGLISGMDTQSIVNKLMAIQRQSYDKTSEKVQAEKVKLQAYQTVNSMLMALKTSVNSLSTQSLWNSKMATSSNESALKATASSSAKEGSYTFRTGKLATTAQYLSKGFSSKDSAVISPGSSKQNGTITLESSKARVDTSARLEDLNGGKGVFRGSIRITDGSNSSAVIDLSTCETIEEVIKAINGSAGCQVEARIMQNADGTSTGDRLEIVNKSGGTGPLKIQNVGQATTATDLGIDQTSSDGSVKGTSIFYMGDDTLLSTLNDGKGIEEGLMNITVKLGSQEIEVDIDLRNARTVSDITNAVNNAIKSVADGKVLYNAKGEIDMENGTPHADRALLANLKLVVNDEGNGLTFTGGVENAIYTVTDLYGTNEYGQQQLGKPETVKQLGLYGIYQVDSTGVFRGSQLLGDISSPMLKNLAGANKTGIGSDSGASKVPAATFDRNTLLSSLNGGKGIGLGGGPALESPYMSTAGRLILR